ncbi:MAG: hypothetical protein ACFFE8_17115 [Candidatus Heimdallarchaeota archaeon]
MTSIAYFISDHGLGHATRSVAIIRALLECDLDVKVTVYTSNPLFFVQRSLKWNEEAHRVSYYDLLNDQGYCQGDVGQIVYPTTAERVQAWIRSWGDQYLFRMYKELKTQEIELVISDIAPQPFLLAKKLEIASVAISNFTWLDVFQHAAFNPRDLETIWKAYREASMGLMLPLNLKNAVFPTILETSMVSRSPTRTPRETRRQMEIGFSDQVIYAGTGMSMKNPFREDWLKNDDTIFVLGSETTCNRDNVRLVPSTDTEGQDYIACSDLALIKVGYGSVSEAIRNKVPIIGVDFAQTSESKCMAQKIESLGIGRCISAKEYLQGKWKDFILEVLDLKPNYRHLPDRFVQNGEVQVADLLLTLIEEAG